MGEGQRSHWSRSNQDPKQRQVGSQQRQVASFLYFFISEEQRRDLNTLITSITLKLGFYERK